MKDLSSDITQIGVGILGFGTVGAGVAAGLIENSALLSERTNINIQLRKIADLDIASDRGVTVPPEMLTTDAMALINDPDIHIIVELIGGCEIAKQLICAALSAGKSVVTANKKLLAEHGTEIFARAAENNTDIYFGASVGGGIPIIRALRDGLVGNHIESIYAILNGTCNYMLSKMEEEGLPFDRILADAQKLGFAEADPSLDVDGFDTLHKATILATLAFGISPDVHTLPVKGIRNVIDAEDIRCAAELGYRIKLLAIIKNDKDGIEIRVAPTLVPKHSMLGSVSGVFNAALVKSDLADETLYYGRGAGRRPTASTVIGDIVDIARKQVSGATSRIAVPLAKTPARIKEKGAITSRFYIRISLADRAGSLAAVTHVFAKHQVSISAAVQKNTPNSNDDFATIVILTHLAKQSDIDTALKAIAELPCCGGTPSHFGIKD